MTMTVSPRWCWRRSNIGGKPTKVVMDANRNGFFYVLDRTNGKLIAANQYAHQTWAKGIDESGRPIPTEITDQVRKGKEVDVWPGAMGTKNWSPVSYNPQTGLVYANTLLFGMHYKPVDVQYPPGPDLLGRRYLVALARWPARLPEGDRSAYRQVEMGGAERHPALLRRAFNRRRRGVHRPADRRIRGVRCRQRNKLWQFKTGSGIEGQPVTWMQDGVQYVAVSSGIGGVYALFSGDERLAKVPAGGSLWVFALTR